MLVSSKSKTPFKKSEVGAVNGVMILIALLIAIMELGAIMIGYKAKNTNLVKVKNSENLIVSSFVDTFSAILKFSESSYLIETNSCVNANMFIDALARGHKCDSVASLNVFRASDLQGLSAADKSGVTFRGGWTISRNGAAAGPADREIVSISLPYFSGDSFLGQFYLKQIVEDQNLAVIELKVSHPYAKTFTRQFSVFTSDQPYQMHLRTADAAVVSSAEVPNDPCDNVQGDLYQDPSRTCSTAESLGGGTGLVNYRNQYFGLHSGLGFLVSLSGSATHYGLPVPENGILSSTKVFPPYSYANLINVTDMEINAQDQGRDEVVVVQGHGVSTSLRYLDIPNGTNQTICKLGELGLQTRVVGITAISGNQSLLKQAPEYTAGVANFLIKNTSGALFYLNVRAQNSAPTAVPESAIQTVHDTNLDRYFVCSLKKLNVTENDLMKITLGSTRTGFEKGDYIVY